MSDGILDKIETVQIDYNGVYQKVTDKKNDFNDLWARLDNDKKLLINDKFIWYDENDIQIPDVDNITLNDASVFANKVHNTLIKAEVLPEVSGDDINDEQADIIESFIEAIANEADMYASHQDIPSYKVFDITQACDRGAIIRRVTLRQEGDKLSADSFSPVDRRYFIYEDGIDKPQWCATQTSRSADDVKEEYGYEPTGKDVIITDHWDEYAEVVYCGREKIWEQENYWQEPPFVIQIMPTGVFTFDADRMLYNGESIFAQSRDLFKEKNIFASILKSLTVKSFFNGLQIEVEDMNLAKQPAIPPWRKRIVAPVKEGTKGYFSMPIQELQNSARMFYGILDTAIQDATFARVSYGSTQYPISGSAVYALKEAEDPVYFPRLQGYALFLQKLFRMVIRQYTMFNYSMKLGEDGHQRTYKASDLDKEFDLNFEITLISPTQDLANISAYAAVGNALSEDTKMRDYLHVKNVTDEQRKKSREKARRLSPVVDKYYTVIDLLDSEKEEDKMAANLMAEEMGIDIDKLIAGELPERTGEIQEDEPQQIMPTFGSRSGSVPVGESTVAEE